MTEPGLYDGSYPPEILRGYVAPVIVEGAARRSSGSLTVTAGEPGAYEPETAPRDRPRNVTELRDLGVMPSDLTPWPAGSYVLVGTSGKRAHWGGDDWHSDESPGYAETEPDEPEHEGPAPTEVEPVEVESPATGEDENA